MHKNIPSLWSARHPEVICYSAYKNILQLCSAKHPEVTCCSAYKNLQLCSAKTPVAAALPRNANSTHESYCTVSSNVVHLMELNNLANAPNKIERTSLRTGRFTLFFKASQNGPANKPASQPTSTRASYPQAEPSSASTAVTDDAFSSTSTHPYAFVTCI